MLQSIYAVTPGCFLSRSFRVQHTHKLKFPASSRFEHSISRKIREWEMKEWRGEGEGERARKGEMPISYTTASGILDWINLRVIENGIPLSRITLRRGMEIQFWKTERAGLFHFPLMWILRKKDGCSGRPSSSAMLPNERYAPCGLSYLKKSKLRKAMITWLYFAFFWRMM